MYLFDTKYNHKEIDDIIGGSNPVGTIIAFMGNTPPDGYLVCDGKTYNITDYQELANFFKDQFGSYNKFGGNGTTTFAVPNLKDRFVKGSTTAGTLQDAGLPNLYGTFNHDWGSFASKYASELGAFKTGGSVSNSGTSGGGSTDSRAIFDANKYNSIYGKSDTVTPKNISALYCIKASDAT